MSTQHAQITREISSKPIGSRLGSAALNAIRQIMWGEGPQSSTDLLEPPSSSLRPISTQRCAVLVLDASPSMEDSDWPPSRIAAAKDAAHAYIGQVARDDPQARVAIVAYSKQAKTMLGLTLVTQKRSLNDAIDRISTSSATNITAGLEAATHLLRKSEGSNQILLLTDGDHNWGPSPLDLVDKLHRIATVECVGIGARGDVNEELLMSLASPFPDGSRRYRWIGDKARLVEHFRQVAGRLTRS